MAKKKAVKKARTKKKTTQIETPAKELRCFIIMPFSKAEFTDSSGVKRSLNQKKLKHIYTKLIRRAVKEYKKRNIRFASVHKYEKTRGNFVKGIVNDLDNADLVIADLTGLNPNVFYELGIRHTLRVGTIMLTQDINSLPADLKSYVAFDYKYPEEAEAFDEYYPKFKKSLHKAINEYLLDHKEGEYDNPVRDFIGSRQVFRDEIRIKEIEGNLEFLVYLMIIYCSDISGLLSYLGKWSKGTTTLFNIAAISAIDKFIIKLVSQNESCSLFHYLFTLQNDLNVINTNQRAVSRRVANGKDVNLSRELAFGFHNSDIKFYHLLDIANHHDKLGDERIAHDDPVIRSLKVIRDQWLVELSNLR